MIIGKLDVMGTRWRPAEADAEWIVDPDRMLSVTVSSQQLESIAGRRPQIVQRCGGIDHQQLVPGGFEQARRKALHQPSSIDGFSRPILEASDQAFHAFCEANI
jgi:hypothetical protein